MPIISRNLKSEVWQKKLIFQKITVQSITLQQLYNN